MSNRAEEVALRLYPESSGPMERSIFEDRRVTLACRRACENGYEQAEKDTRDIIASCRMKNWREGYDDGYKQAEKDLGWHSVDECLPEIEEEVIVLKDILVEDGLKVGFGKIAFGHIVDTERCIDYNGWNIPGVRFWMPCPKIPEE